jgi:hypothetical protein
MSDTDKFMQEDFLPFCKRASDAFEQNHHTLYATFSRFMSGKNLIGIRIDNGVLSSEIHTPFGVIKPYVILEKSTVEKMIQDEPSFIAHPFATKFKYYPEMTVKFLK